MPPHSGTQSTSLPTSKALKFEWGQWSAKYSNIQVVLKTQTTKGELTEKPSHTTRRALLCVGARVPQTSAQGPNSVKTWGWGTSSQRQRKWNDLKNLCFSKDTFLGFYLKSFLLHFSRHIQRLGENDPKIFEFARRLKAKPVKVRCELALK